MKPKNIRCGLDKKLRYLSYNIRRSCEKRLGWYYADNNHDKFINLKFINSTVGILNEL